MTGVTSSVCGLSLGKSVSKFSTIANRGREVRGKEVGLGCRGEPGRTHLYPEDARVQLASDRTGSLACMLAKGSGAILNERVMVKAKE